MAKVSVSTLAKKKQQGEKITALTAYDASFAKLFYDNGVDVVLVGDSLGMVLQGGDDTLAVTTDDIAYHTRSVRAGTKELFVIADMPFMSYSNPAQACENAATLMRSGANMVKLEGGTWLVDSIKLLTQQGIPVCGHLGLTPQSVHVFGGFKIQGREEEQALQMIADAQALEAAGAQMLVIECIPSSLAKRITDAVNIPVIGIGAGKEVDGQILVMHDLVGISAGYIPKFSKNYLAETGNMPDAVKKFCDDVKSGAFPGKDHEFN
ncbi:3-methyl-2-oxobutanoate hydroxymethyltransferase [Pseudoalteromonas luteoviolacea]|uniref:3-methyl-2-oxobutanoate hydroxymethyltransferase n=1 Tax=Pseudoalteromonas luteoviolacea S4054 TaxID=1129367 RepID=A0A0F6A9Y5_9GAMM|nr:3-methyl-2-oxobutanoate hydroxymethyltransferase [Pseudoalteromonas luteoviolacea]AOT07016.1 3-methyl-2-oxobutanoate hydroxymethyltransferase [Pseudoalteromonas luteoviolacea]AOT11934.1 3-methyl-2-oxobutanoate hydroxymethyltransferase [Pseudoalteromonas luteoviolacea]AOT16846.1 3-methyl-2-oxobutanoate hydroxymethyltransferase [Pseudoalteromonas luteoviolacea]KKE82661.1 3-methyl-2-oxobutanoate hydroxymethyltransferase [Pseudoalteromonas luteoviolacea S4054]KZN69905.1 3-methyl-2-oxobutanoate 